jgi:hypothetical protein
MDAEGTGANGYVRWRDMDSSHTALREDLRADYRREHDSLTTSISTALSEQKACVDDLDERLDKVESFLDRQNGAWTVAKWLIGSNLTLTVVGLITLFITLRPSP